ncbi:MAG: hypothetical protein A3K18_05535 [Lentisphaerae bacterium RIFOXYA12_64_32]|nr:MAG: hypothetical protein A3K18_05535 [Lentisphaerae bacterium RIFOXYA12_64_32]
MHAALPRFGGLWSMVFVGALVAQALGCLAQGTSSGGTTEMAEQTRVLYGNWQELKKRQLRLLPVPKRIEFAGTPITLAGDGAGDVVIVLGRDTERGRIAAAEITSRLADFSLRRDIPVVSAACEGAYNIVIENEWPNTFTRDEARPDAARTTDQAYGLYPAADRITLSGQGEIGMMYAAVTLRFLMAEVNGRVVLHPARVTDWPDYKHRHMGTLLAPYQTCTVQDGTEKHLANMARHIDWLFRMKATGTFRQTLGSVEHSSLPDQVAGSDGQRACAKAVSDYARQRGFVTMHNGSVSLGLFPQDKDRPGFDQMMLDKGRGHYHSWARHDLHLNQARNMAEFCKQCGFDLSFIHAVDAGGVLDPELWSKRDELTRQKYGDDRVQADADMFNIYAEAMKSVGAEVVFVAYPYTASYLDPAKVLTMLGMPDSPAARQRAEDLAAQTRAWMTGVNGKLAPRVRMCIREGPRQEMAEYYAAYPGRPMWIYWEVTHYVRSIYPLIPTQVRCIGCGYSPDRSADDIIWVNDIDYVWFSEPVRAVGCEYAWNTQFPGCSEFDPEYMHEGETQIDDQAALDIMAERAATGLWGAEAADDLKELFRHHLSWRVAADPKGTTKRLPASVLPPLLKTNRDAAQRACVALDRFWEKQKRAGASGGKLLDDFSRPFFVQFYAMAKAAKAYANVHGVEADALEKIQGGDLDGATADLGQGRQVLASDRAEYDQTLAELKDEPWVISPASTARGVTGRVEFALLRPDFAALEKKLTDLDQDKTRIYEQHNIPGWFRKWFTGREVVAVKTSEPVVLDGELSEPAWNTAPPIEHFVGHGQFKMMSTPCAARLLYDGTCLYLGGTIVQPSLDKIREEPRAADQYAFTEAVEFLFVPGETGKTDLFQFVVDTAGNLFTMREFATPQGEAKRIEGWDSGATVAVKKGDGVWAFELAIPFDRLGKTPANDWHAVVARNAVEPATPGTVATYASAFFDGASYQTATVYPPLRFASQVPAPKEYRPSLRCVDPGMQTRTTQRGAGSEIRFGVNVETLYPLLDATVGVDVLDPDGNRVGGVTVLEKPVLPLAWSTAKPVLIQLDNEYKAVRLRLTLRNRSICGGPETLEKIVCLGDISALFNDQQVFPDGVLPGTCALGAPILFDANTPAGRMTSLERGTIEFWVKPEWDAATADPKERDAPRNYLFHIGPLLGAEHPKSENHDCMVFWRETSGYVGFEIMNSDYDRRLAHARLPDWKRGEWHHVACVWDLNADGKSRLELYLDGKLAANKVRGKKDWDDSSMKTPVEAYAVQVGSLNSGHCPAAAAVDELRLWNVPRYAAGFEPAKDVAQPADGALVFRFEKTLAGQYLLGGKTGEIAARVGAQRSP